MGDEGARNCHALPLAAGKLEGLVAEVAAQAHRLHDFHDPVLLLLRR